MSNVNQLCNLVNEHFKTASDAVQNALVQARSRGLFNVDDQTLGQICQIVKVTINETFTRTSSNLVRFADAMVPAKKSSKK